jgi:hypothetical protein
VREHPPERRLGAPDRDLVSGRAGFAGSVGGDARRASGEHPGNGQVIAIGGG